MPYLLAIALGPVQDFIAASRKARDLWFGSDLLSRVAREAAFALHDNGAALIFPTAEALSGSTAVANKLLAVVEATDAQTPRDLAAKARDRAERYILAEWGLADDRQAAMPTGKRPRDRLTDDPPKAIEVIDEDLLRAQLRDFLEWYAAWVPYDPSAPPDAEASYAKRRAEADRLLAGRKTLRDFRPPATAAGQPHTSLDGRPKSSLDPSRESVVHADAIAEIAKQDPGRASRIRRRLRLKGAEQLDGISLVKRLGGQNRLVSVSRVAIDPFIRRAVEEGEGAALARLRGYALDLARSDLAEAFSADRPELRDAATRRGLHRLAATFSQTDEQIDHYRAFPFDCQLFYAESRKGAEQLVDRRDPERDPDRGKSRLSQDEAKAAEAFITELRGADGRVGLRERLGGGELPTYLAVLVADGDRMGEALGTLDAPDLHQTFSRHLADFAVQAGRVVRTHHGAMVYSGGDDVLAFLPLDTVLPCAHALRRVFAKTMDAALPLTAAKPTLSAGVAIGHYAEHLQNLLQWGREAERAAKRYRTDGQIVKNALAVSLRTRSGEAVRTVVHSWTEDPVATRWGTAINLHSSEALPDSAVYDLDRLVRELGDAPGPLGGGRSSLTPAHVADLIRNEVPRVLTHKRGERGARRLTDREVQDLVDRAGGTPVGLRRLVDELLISRRLARAVAMGGETARERWRDTEDGPGIEITKPSAPPTEERTDAA